MKGALKIIAVFVILTPLKAQFMEPFLTNTDSEIYTTSFIAEWGGDTASIETFTIVGNNLFGKAIHLYPEPHLVQFEFTFMQDGSMQTLDFTFWDLENTSIPLQTKSGFLPYRQTMNSSNELIKFRNTDQQGEKLYVHYSKGMDFAGGWVPIIGQWQWLTDLLVKDKLKKELKFLNSVIGDYDMELKRSADNIVIFDSDITAPITFYLDNDQKIEKIDAIGSPWNYIIKRHEPIDIETYCAQFAKKKVIGNPSPHDSFETEIADCDITLDYGRPSKRGRQIFGNVVPYGKIWRTGAGSPTTISFTEDLNFNGVIIPKGAYNLFTIPNKDSWELIFNTEKEAWGSAHRAEFDFAKVTMTSTEQADVIEKFTMEIIPKSENKGVLKLSWDTTSAYVEFEVK